MFQEGSSQQSSKSLVSRLPKGSRSMCLPLRPVTSRSSEDLLRDSWLSTEEMVDEPQEDDRDLTEPVCVSPSLPCPESSTGSSVLDSLNSESLTCNSALESPDSWADSDSAVMVETFGENPRICSVCDSRTCDCVLPVEASTPDEGFIPSTEDETPPVDNEPATTESSTGEVIYFQRSSEKTHEEFHDFGTYQEAAELRREDENQTQVSNPVEETTECNRVEVTNIIDSEQADSGSLFMKDEVRGEEAGPCECAEGEKVISCGDGTETATVSQHAGILEVPTPKETGKQNVDETEGTELLEDAGDHDHNNALNNEAQTTEKGENQNEIKPLEDVESDVKSDMESKEPSVDLQDTSLPGTSEGPATILPSHQEQPSPTPLDPSPRRSRALRSTSSEQEEEGVERTCDMEINVTKENEDFSIVSCNQTDVDNKDSGVFSFTVIENDEPTASSSLDNTNITETNKLCENVLLAETSQMQENTNEHEEEEKEERSVKKSDADMKGNIDTLGNLESQSLETEYGTNQQDKQQDQKLSESRTGQQDTLDLVDSEQSSLRTIGGEENGAEMERSDSQIYDSVGVSVEPMDIFYPEKEEPLSSEPIDMEVQGWPLVLSVSALQPAPATDMLPEEQPLNLEEDLPNVERLSEQVIDKVNPVTEPGAKLSLQWY